MNDTTTITYQPDPPEYQYCPVCSGLTQVTRTGMLSFCQECEGVSVRDPIIEEPEPIGELERVKALLLERSQEVRRLQDRICREEEVSDALVDALNCAWARIPKGIPLDGMIHAALQKWKNNRTPL